MKKGDKFEITIPIEILYSAFGNTFRIETPFGYQYASINDIKKWRKSKQKKSYKNKGIK